MSTGIARKLINNRHQLNPGFSGLSRELKMEDPRRHQLAHDVVKAVYDDQRELTLDIGDRDLIEFCVDETFPGAIEGETFSVLYTGEGAPTDPVNYTVPAPKPKK